MEEGRLGLVLAVYRSQVALGPRLLLIAQVFLIQVATLLQLHRLGQVEVVRRRNVQLAKVLHGTDSMLPTNALDIEGTRRQIAPCFTPFDVLLHSVTWMGCLGKSHVDEWLALVGLIIGYYAL